MQDKSYTNVSFSVRFSDLCTNSDLPQNALAEILGLSVGAIINYKKGRIPKAEELHRIASYFGVSMEWLLTGQDDKPVDQWRHRAEVAEKKLEAMKAGLYAFIKKF